MNEREQFEAWAVESGVGYRTEKHGLMFYDAGEKHAAWKAWQARAALAASPVPAGYSQEWCARMAQVEGDAGDPDVTVTSTAMLNGLTESETLATASVAGLSAPAQQARDAFVSRSFEVGIPQAVAELTAAPAPSVEAQADDAPTYTTEPGESTAGIALRELGDERRWREIVALNADRFPDQGPHDYYPVGTVLNMPTQAPSVEAQAQADKNSAATHWGTYFIEAAKDKRP